MKVIHIEKWKNRRIDRLLEVSLPINDVIDSNVEVMKDLVDERTTQLMFVVINEIENKTVVSFNVEGIRGSNFDVISTLLHVAHEMQHMDEL